MIDYSALHLKIQGTFKTSKTSIQSRWDFKRDWQSHQNLYSLDVRIHHRIWDDQKHLLHIRVKVKEKIIDYSALHLKIKGHLKRLKHLFNQGETSTETGSRIKTSIQRCENWSQNLGCSKTSTSHACKTEEKDDWLLSNQSECSRESLKSLKHLFNQIETTTETSSRMKAFIH